MAESKDNVTDKEHDKGYRDILSNKDAFLHFLKKYIGKPWAKDITPDDIERVDTSFVTPEYKDLDSDLIFKVSDFPPSCRLFCITATITGRR